MRVRYSEIGDLLSVLMEILSCLLRILAVHRKILSQMATIVAARSKWQNIRNPRKLR
jgi:hypothetical protein